jgi:hypothetical protein
MYGGDVSDSNPADRPADRATSTRRAVEDLVRRFHATPVVSIEDLSRYQADVWESDEELTAFLANVRTKRNADLA